MFRFLLLSALAGLFSSAWAGSDSTATIRVGKFWVMGNEQTDSWVIERELPFRYGDLITEDELEFTRARIEATGLFNRVVIVKRPGIPAGYTDLEIQVTETFYLYPVPVFDFVGGRFSDINYGGGLIHRNFRGNAEILGFTGWLGYSPGFSFYYENPWIGGKSRHFLSAEISRYSAPSRTLTWDSFDEYWWKLNLFVKKYTNRYFYLGLGLSENHIRLATAEPVNGNGPTEFWFFAPYLEASYDSRDFPAYAHRGMLAKLRVTKNGISNPDINNWMVAIDGRYFLRLAERQAIGFNSAHLVTIGSPEVFQYNYLGYENRLRGYFYDVVESKNLTLTQVEYRFPVSKIWYINPGLANSTTGQATENLKFGFSGTLFAAHAISWDSPDNVSVRNTRSGYGAGLNIIVPYLEAIRLEAAFNDKGTFNAVFALGVSF